MLETSPELSDIHEAGRSRYVLTRHAQVVRPVFSYTKELHIAGAFSPDYFTQKPFQMQQVGLTDLFYFIFYLRFLLFTAYGKLRPYVCFHNPSKQVPKGI